MEHNMNECGMCDRHTRVFSQILGYENSKNEISQTHRENRQDEKREYGKKYGWHGKYSANCQTVARAYRPPGLATHRSS